MGSEQVPPGLARLGQFSLVDALVGRRSRRFALGATLPGGPLAFSSRQAPLPLSEVERLVLLTACAGVTGWHDMIPHHPRYAPAVPSYSAGAGGRSFPSAAGWQTSEIFFSDDSGTYLFATRDAPPAQRQDGQPGAVADFAQLVEAHRSRIRPIAGERIGLPRDEAHIEGHNLWCANVPGSLLIIPVADIAQHLIAELCFLVQNGACVYDNLHGAAIPGIERFRGRVDVDHPAPLSEVELAALTMVTAEVSTCCYAGMLMLQAMGLGGWLYTGLNWLSVLGVSDDPAASGLGFRYDVDPRWPIPNPTGREGVFEGFCPPHYASMRAAVEAFVARKYGPGGPFNPATPGLWRESAMVRGGANPHDEQLIECVALMAQYIFDRFGKFPASVPSVLVKTVLQAHHLDLEFYDRHFAPGAYLHTHASHMADWHPERAAGDT
jgi:hypothetical protein